MSNVLIGNYRIFAPDKYLNKIEVKFNTPVFKWKDTSINLLTMDFTRNSTKKNEIVLNIAKKFKVVKVRTFETVNSDSFTADEDDNV